MVKMYTKEFLDKLLDDINIEWVWSNPIAAYYLINNLLYQLLDIDMNINCLPDDSFTEDSMKNVNKWNKEMYSLYDYKRRNKIDCQP